MFFIVAGRNATSIALSILFSVVCCLLSDSGLPRRWQPFSNWLPWKLLVLLVIGYIAMYCSRLIHPDAEPEENERTREARVHALVNELPIESWMCQSSRQSASVSELRQRLRHRTGCANASVPSVRVLLEKEDLVNELERAPHDTLCSIVRMLIESLRPSPSRRESTQA